MTSRGLAFLPVVLFACGIAPAASEGAPPTKCTMKFSLKGYSLFYKKADGQGTITCGNGESAKVKISLRGGGLTFGKNEVDEGEGRFSEVTGIDQIFGAYGAAEAQAGVGNSAQAAAYTKGSISLVLTGKGRGSTVGFAFGKLELTRLDD